MRVSLPRIGFALVLACTVSLSACVAPPKGTVIPPTGATPQPSSFLLYVADLATNDVSAIDPFSGKTLATIPVGTAPAAITFGASQLGNVPRYGFVANSGSNTVSVIDPLTNTIVKTIPVGSSPSAVIYDEPPSLSFQGVIWVANSGDGTVSEIDAQALKVLATLTVGGHPTALAAFGLPPQSAVAVMGSEGTVTFINPGASPPIQQRLTTHANPAVVAVSADLFVASTDGIVQRFRSALADGDTVAHPYSFNQQNTSASGFTTGTNLLRPQVFALSNTSNGVVQIFNYIDVSLGNDTMTGTTQTLTTGSGPTGAAYAELTSGSNAGAYLFVANKNSDNISMFTGTDSLGVLRFNNGTLLPLASGTHPVAIAVYNGIPQAASTPTPTPVSTATPTPVPTATPTPVSTATPIPSAATHLYIANYGGGNVAQYAAPFSNASVPSATFSDTTPIGGPVGIAANGTYVATSHVTGSVSAYRQPVSASSTAVATFGGSAMGLMTFDAQGNLWATSQNSSVVEYVPPFTNSTVEAKSLTTGFTSSYGIAFDASGTMYVTNSDSSATIVVYAPPYTSPSNTFTVSTPNARLHGAAVNGSNLYVADTSNNLIYVYALPMTTNIATEAFTATAPMGLAFDASGNLYVTSQGTNQIQIFNPPFNSGSRPAVTVTSGVSQAFGIAVGP